MRLFRVCGCKVTTDFWFVQIFFEKSSQLFFGGNLWMRQASEPQRLSDCCNKMAITYVSSYEYLLNIKTMKMKILAVTAMAAAFMTSCGPDRAQVDAVDPSTIVEKIRTCDNDDSLRIYVDAANDYAAKLASENKLDSAKIFLDEVKPVVEKKDSKLLSTFKSVEGVIAGAAESVGEFADTTYSNVKEGVTDAAEKVGDKAEEVKDKAVEAVKDKAEEVKGKAVEKGGKAVEAVKDKTNEIVDKGVDKGGKIVNAVKDKTKEIVDKGVDKTKDVVGK